jgi:hypothetical protein
MTIEINIWKGNSIYRFWLYGSVYVLPNISVFLQEHSTNSYQKLIFNVYSKQSKGKEAGKFRKF